MLNFRASESLVVLFLQNNEAGIRRQYHEYSDCSKDPKNPHLNQADLQKIPRKSPSPEMRSILPGKGTSYIGISLHVDI